MTKDEFKRKTWNLETGSEEYKRYECEFLESEAQSSRDKVYKHKLVKRLEELWQFKQPNLSTLMMLKKEELVELGKAANELNKVMQKYKLISFRGFTSDKMDEFI